MTLDPGHMDANNLTVREVEWSGRGALPISVPTILPGTEDAKNGSPLAAATPLRLRHPVAAGQPVTRADVEAVSLVTRGEYATLRSVHGPIELESRVEVLQDGGPGQTVRVKLANASSAILARVTGPGTVEIRQ
jgi:flagella basal body P-ring formation protein FlgA